MHSVQTGQFVTRAIGIALHEMLKAEPGVATGTSAHAGDVVPRCGKFSNSLPLGRVFETMISLPEIERDSNHADASAWRYRWSA